MSGFGWVMLTASAVIRTQRWGCEPLPLPAEMVSLEATELMEGDAGSDEWKPRTQVFFSEALV